jgi:hypothetical protein
VVKCMHIESRFRLEQEACNDAWHAKCLRQFQPQRGKGTACRCRNVVLVRSTPSWELHGGCPAYFESDVRNMISQECQSKVWMRNVPQRSWCKGTIIEISYYLVRRVCNHWQRWRGRGCLLPCDEETDRRPRSRRPIRQDLIAFMC